MSTDTHPTQQTEDPQVRFMDSFKEAMSLFPSGVTIITTRDDAGEPVGMTASAFVSVSLTPPLVLESIAKTAQMHEHLMRTDRYAVSILAEGQSLVSNHFAGWGQEGFSPTLATLGGLPIIQGSLAQLTCKIVNRVDAGDHTLFIGCVEELSLSTEGLDPLIYAKRGYRSLAPVSTKEEPHG